MKDEIVFMNLNVDEGAKFTSKYGTKNIPTLVLFKGGEEIGRLVGTKEIEEKIKKMLLKA